VVSRVLDDDARADDDRDADQFFARVISPGRSATQGGQAATAATVPTNVIIVGRAESYVPSDPWFYRVIEIVAWFEIALSVIPAVMLAVGLLILLVSTVDGNADADAVVVRATTGTVGMVTLGMSALFGTFCGGLQLLIVDVARNIRAQRYKL
jgi:hypothetical protein